MKTVKLLLIAIICLFNIEGFTKPLTPFDYGLKDARTDIERYEVLLQTHTMAVKMRKAVSYKGIGEICIEIPKGGKSIPLSYKTDFAGVKIIVKNKAQKIALFEFQREVFEVFIPKEILITGSFKKINELRGGKKMLVIKDQTRWVAQRVGYNGWSTRKDLLLLKKGKVRNSVVSTYDDNESDPKFYWCQIGGKQVVFKNLTFERTNDSDFITNLCFFSNVDNILFKNVRTITPSNTGLYGDCIIKLENCANITFEDVTIEGTYSLKDKYGYGIGMDNVWNVSFFRLKANGEWGVFGNNNVNCAKLDDCDINRFDIHCYGKDVYCKNTIFRDLYNQFSSLYGTLRFEGCHFVSFIPVLFESSYSAYTYFSLEFEDCIIDVDCVRPYLISAGNPAELPTNSRKALSKACWPDVKLKNLTINLPPGSDDWIIFQLSSGAGTKVYGIAEIDVDGLIINGSGNKPKVVLSNKEVIFDRQLIVRVRNSNIENIKNE